MNLLRDRWRRSALCQYLDHLEPIDRATVLIVWGLVVACALSAAAIARYREPSVGLVPASNAPRLTAPPFELQFAAADHG